MTIVAIPPLVPLPVFPSPNLPEDQYDDAAFAWGNTIPAHSNSAAAVAEAGRTNALDAQASAQSAAASATAANGSAGAAANSANAAGNSATAAAGNATAAAGSATAAQASYSNLQKLYLGPKTAPPTTDNSGNALQTGAWYVNTTQGSWFWWNGANWILGMSDVAGSFVPLAGGVTMTGHLSVPAGASGNQVRRASEIDAALDAKANLAGATFTGLLRAQESAGAVTSNGSGTLQVMATSGNGAYMSFHRSGQYAINFGLDTDNVIRLGGWSAGVGVTRLAIDASGNYTATGNVTAYSDERLKKDWTPVSGDFVGQLAQLLHGTYTRIDTGERQAGVAAQGLRNFLPEVVMEDADGTLSVAYGNAAMVACVQLANYAIRLEERLRALEAKQ